MDVIANAGAINGRVVIAIHRQLRQLARSHLADIRQEVVGQSVGILPNQTAAVRAYGVEIAQQRDAPAWVSGAQIAEAALHHDLRLPVWVGRRAGWQLLVQWHLVRLAIYRGRRAEHKFENVGDGHGFAQDERAGDVIAVIQQRFGNAFAHCFEAGEVHDSVDAVVGENTVEQSAIIDIALYKC